MAPEGSADEAEERVARCAERIQGLYGDGLETAPGVLQPMAVWADGTGRLFTIDIGPESPESATDRFVLGIARARVDAIVTTGRILRDEPDVRHDYGDPDLADWRAARCGRRGAPASVVITRREDLDFGHPFFGAERIVVVTGKANLASLRERAPGNVEVVGRDRTDLRETIRWLRESRGFESVSVEAGPSTSLDLYRDPVVVDELMLSIFQAPSLPESARGGAFLDVADVDRLFAAGVARRSECIRDEDSGTWSYCRFSSRS